MKELISQHQLSMLMQLSLRITYSPIPNIKKIRPDILMESRSHSEEETEESRRAMESWGGRVVCMPYYPSQCSTKIKNKIINGK